MQVVRSSKSLLPKPSSCAYWLPALQRSCSAQDEWPNTCESQRSFKTLGKQALPNTCWILSFLES
jgi:hypothetical protein